MKITTYEELKAALQAWLLQTDSKDKVTTDADVFRFIAVQMANEAAEMHRREMIDLYVHGIPPMSVERVVEWLECAEEFAEGRADAEEEIDGYRPSWDDLFEEFYGPKVG